MSPYDISVFAQMSPVLVEELRPNLDKQKKTKYQFFEVMRLLEPILPLLGEAKVRPGGVDNSSRGHTTTNTLSD